jgi:cytochrome c oxidase assembly factor CtaG
VTEIPTLLADGGLVPLWRVGDTWRSAPAVVVPAALLVVLFIQAFVRLRRRGRPDHAGWDRLLLFSLAVAIGTLALISPLDVAGEQYLLSAHMLQHVMIGDFAPALALVALRGPLLFFLLPSLVLAPLARVKPLRAVLRQLVVPGVAVGIWAIVIALWHVPSIYDYTLTHRTVHDVEHLCFVIAGVLVWTQIVDPARRHRLTTPQRIAFAAAVFSAGQVLSYVLIFSFRALYPAYSAQHDRMFGWSPLLDQQFAGLTMMGEQLLTLGTACALLLVPYLRARGRDTQSAQRPRRGRARARDSGRGEDPAASA